MSCVAVYSCFRNESFSSVGTISHGYWEIHGIWEIYVLLTRFAI